MQEMAQAHKKFQEGGDGNRPNPKEHFKKMDADNNGTVSLEEFKSNPRAKENPEKATEIFKKMDADSSGGVTLEEMIEHHKKHRPDHREGGPEGGDKGDGGEAKEKSGPTVD
jgi:Ca2+-binding EF-hand superfamily protein